MRLYLALPLMLLPVSAFADRLISIPTALKVRYNTARLEHQWDLYKPELRRSYLGVGLTRDIDTEFILNTIGNNKHLASAHLSYQFMVPLVDTAPGLSFGVQDLANKADGQMFYMALTMRYGQDEQATLNSPVELTLGYGFGPKNGFFTGVSLPFSWQFRAMAEHDTRKIWVGFEYSTHQGLAARLMFNDKRPHFGLRWTVKY